MAVGDPFNLESTGEFRRRSSRGIVRAWQYFQEKFSVAATLASLSMLYAVVSYIVTSREEINNATEGLKRLQQTVSEMQRDRAVLHGIETQLAVVGNKVDTIVVEVDRQRTWRAKIEELAEIPPTSRRRR